MRSRGEGAHALLARLDELGASLRIGRDGNLVLRGASRLPADLRAAIRRERAALVEALLARERWVRATSSKPKTTCVPPRTTSMKPAATCASAC